MLFCGCSLRTGVEASAAQNAPVTKTCLQCGAVLPSSLRACSFCDSSLVTEASVDSVSISQSNENFLTQPEPDSVPAWRGVLSERMQTYRSRKRKKPAYGSGQSEFSFEAENDGASVAVTEQRGNHPAAEEDFSFTIAIGRPAKKQEPEDSRLIIDVSARPEPSPESGTAEAISERKPGLYPVASMNDRRLAALFDGGCLLFAYGAFLALFSSLGGEFTLSKLSAVVYTATFAIVYLQYFWLFTIFGGTTPGMMLRSLQVVSFSGEPPTPRQMLLRSFGYILSAGTFFLGFLWAIWDEDSLTWHDRISQTYLSSSQTFADMETSAATQSRPAH